jgi:uncharacterized membrane protein
MDTEASGDLVGAHRSRLTAHVLERLAQARVHECIEWLHDHDATCVRVICIDSKNVYRNDRRCRWAYVQYRCLPGGRVMLGRLFHGLPGHPLHPPLTDATIGMLVLASGLSVIGALDWISDPAGKGAWLALVAGLIVAAPTAVTGFADWLTLDWGSAVWRTATLHLGAMVTAVCLYGVAAWLQWDGYHAGTVTTGGLVFSLLGLVALTAGGWLGGAIVFVHGVRVQAASRAPQEETRNELPRRERGAA